MEVVYMSKCRQGQLVRRNVDSPLSPALPTVPVVWAANRMKGLFYHETLEIYMAEYFYVFPGWCHVLLY